MLFCAPGEINLSTPPPPLNTVSKMAEAQAHEQAQEQVLPLCPRCGASVKGIHRKEVGGRVYLYAYHGKQGKKPVLCYLGPEDYYIHAEYVLTLGLTNLEHVDLLAVAYSAAALYLTRARKLTEEERKEAAKKLRDLASDISQLAEELAQ